MLSLLDLLPHCLRVGGRVRHLFTKSGVIWVLKWLNENLFECRIRNHHPADSHIRWFTSAERSDTESSSPVSDYSVAGENLLISAVVKTSRLTLVYVIINHEFED